VSTITFFVDHATGSYGLFTKYSI